MSEQDQSSSQDLEKADSGFNSEEVKENGVRRGTANDRDVALTENGQQALEMPGTAESDSSERDPKLVYICCLPFFAKETDKSHR